MSYSCVEFFSLSSVSGKSTEKLLIIIMEPLVVGLLSILLSLLATMCGSMVRQKLLNGLKDCITISVIVGTLYGLIGLMFKDVEIRQVWIENWSKIDINNTRAQVISLGILLVLICLLLVRAVGKLMVSKPGSQGTFINSNSAVGPEVNIINTLASLSSAIQTMFPDIAKSNDEKKLSLSELDVKMDMVYSEMKLLKETLLTMMSTWNYTNSSHTIPELQERNNEEIFNISNVNIRDDDDYLISEYDISDTDDELPTVAALHIKKHKKNRSKTVDENKIEKISDDKTSSIKHPHQKELERSTNGSPMDLSQFIEMSEKEVLMELKKRDLLRREQQKLPEYLTSAEKKLAMTDLTKLWLEWKVKNPRAIVKHWDYRNLGVLSEEHAALPRKYVRQIIANRRSEAMLAAAKEEGKEVGKCEICSRVYLIEKGHRCFITGWGSKMPSASLPSNKNIIVSQDGKHDIKISRRQMVDPDKITKEYEKLSQYRILMETTNKSKEQMEAIIPTDLAKVDSIRDPAEKGSLGENLLSDSPLRKENEEVAESANMITIDKNELYGIMKGVVLDVYKSHFRDTLSPKTMR